MNMDDTLQILEKLCNTPSPSGFCHQVMDLVEDEFASMGMSTVRTRKGAIIATLEGKSGVPGTLIAAHVDTLGAMVKEIKKDGRLAFTQVGGYSLTSVECENVTIHTASGKMYSGTIYFHKPSVHIHGSETKTQERKLEQMELVLDEVVLTDKDVAELGIEVGDYISFDPRFRITDSGFVKSRHLDDKAGVACILGACRQLMDNHIVPQDSIQILITNYEEVGHGASYDWEESIGEMLCVDMGAPGEGQNGDEYTVTIAVKDGHGPYDYALRRLLVELAKENEIAYKQDVLVYYGSDAAASLAAGNDMRFGLIGPGVYASHSYERTHMDALENTVRLLMAYMGRGSFQS